METRKEKNKKTKNAKPCLSNGKQVESDELELGISAKNEASNEIAQKAESIFHILPKEKHELIHTLIGWLEQFLKNFQAKFDELL